MNLIYFSASLKKIFSGQDRDAKTVGNMVSCGHRRGPPVQTAKVISLYRMALGHHREGGHPLDLIEAATLAAFSSMPPAPPMAGSGSPTCVPRRHPTRKPN